MRETWGVGPWKGLARRVGPQDGIQGRIDWTPAGSEGEHRRKSQRARILSELRCGDVRRSAMKALGGDRFSARVNELRQEGHRIIGPVKAPRWGINETVPPWPDGEDRYRLEGE